MNKYKAVPIITCLAVAALALGLFLGISFKSKRNGDIADADRSHADAAETVEEAAAHTDSLNVTGNHITADSEGNEQNTEAADASAGQNETLGESVVQNNPDTNEADQEPGISEPVTETVHADGDFVSTDSSFYTYEEMMADLDEMASAYPALLSVRTCGTSLDNRAIPEAVLGNPESEKHIFIQASIHAREYINTLVAMRQIEQMLVHHTDGVYVDASYDDLLSQVCFHILPMSNPDGVTISQMGIEGIRDEDLKSILRTCYQNDLDNGRTSSDTDSYYRTWKANARGVDLNRNFDAGWDTYEGVSYPSSDHYKGPSPVSEPETQAIVNAVHACQAILTISYHSTGSVIYWDYGSTGEVYENDAALANFAHVLTGYSTVSSVQSSQDAAGCSDYFVLRESVPSITIENGYSPCPIGIDEFSSIWNSNQTLLPALAYNYR